MKKYIIIVIALAALSIPAIQASADHRHEKWTDLYDSQRKYNGYMSWHYGPDWDSDDLTSWGFDYHIRITDSNGDTHYLWISYTYSFQWIDEDGNEWWITMSWYQDQDIVDEFWDEHTSN